MQIRAPFLLGGELEVAIHRLKYRGRFEVARSVGRWLEPALEEAISELDIEVVVPIPSPWKTRLRRAMDHPTILYRWARPRVPLVLALYWRRHRRLVGRTRAARAVATRGAMAIRGRAAAGVRGRRVLVVDDVVTTGSTMREAARVLRAVGASEVCGFAVARAE